jgi:hypothetical protein
MQSQKTTLLNPEPSGSTLSRLSRFLTDDVMTLLQTTHHGGRQKQISPCCSHPSPWDAQEHGLGRLQWLAGRSKTKQSSMMSPLSLHPDAKREGVRPIATVAFLIWCAGRCLFLSKADVLWIVASFEQSILVGKPMRQQHPGSRSVCH